MYEFEDRNTRRVAEEANEVRCRNGTANQSELFELRRSSLELGQIPVNFAQCWPSPKKMEAGKNESENFQDRKCERGEEGFNARRGIQ